MTRNRRRRVSARFPSTADETDAAFAFDADTRNVSRESEESESLAAIGLIPDEAKAQLIESQPDGIAFGTIIVPPTRCPASIRVATKAVNKLGSSNDRASCLRNS